MPAHPEPHPAAPARRPTQHDVARAAGVSRGTVSYVLNGQADGKVAISPETRARVWAAIEELGYMPDAGARALRSGTTRTIGLIIPDLHNPHFWQNANGVEEEARAAGYRMLLASMELNNAYGAELFKDLSGRRIDALILSASLLDQSSEAREILLVSLRRGLAIVALRDQPIESLHVDGVISDYRAATAAAVAHLFALGHRRIGFIYGVAQEILAEDRLQTYRNSLEVAHLPADPALVAECGPTMEDGYRAATALLSLRERPTAILCVNDLLAMAALRAVVDNGLRVPQDLSLVGFDDIPAAQYLTPRLTTASKDAVRMGREAVRLALKRLADPTLPPQIVEIPARFIVRESTGPAPDSVKRAAFAAAHVNRPSRAGRNKEERA